MTLSLMWILFRFQVVKHPSRGSFVIYQNGGTKTWQYLPMSDQDHTRYSFVLLGFSFVQLFFLQYFKTRDKSNSLGTTWNQTRKAERGGGIPGADPSRGMRGGVPGTTGGGSHLRSCPWICHHLLQTQNVSSLWKQRRME